MADRFLCIADVALWGRKIGGSWRRLIVVADVVGRCLDLRRKRERVLYEPGAVAEILVCRSLRLLLAAFAAAIAIDVYGYGYISWSSPDMAVGMQILWSGLFQLDTGSAQSRCL